MRRFLVLTHGQLALGIIDSIGVITGQHPPIDAITVSADDAPETIKGRIDEFMDRAAEGDSNIIVTDIPGGSTTRNAFEYAMNPNTYVVSGVNLSLLLELFMNSEEDDEAAMIRNSIENAKKSFIFVNDMIENKKAKESESI